MEWKRIKADGVPKERGRYLFAFKGWNKVDYKIGGLRPDGRLFLEEDPERLIFKKNLIAYAKISEPKLPKKLYQQYHR